MLLLIITLDYGSFSLISVAFYLFRVVPPSKVVSLTCNESKELLCMSPVFGTCRTTCLVDGTF